MKRKLLFIGVCVAVIIGAMLLFKNNTKNTPRNVKPVSSAIPVTTATVTAMRVEYVLEQVGTLTASQEVSLRSKAQGRVMDILFKEGKSVRKDDILVRVDDAKIKAEIQNLTARINQLEIRLENKIRSLERNRSLVEQNLVSKEMYDNLQTEINEIKSQITQTQASLAQQKESLADTLILAPFNGVAGPRTFSVGHYLRIGDPVVSIVDLNALEIAFKVPEKYKQNLLPGQTVYLVVDAYPDKKFNGEIFFIDPEVSVDTRTFFVKAKVDNSDKALNPGMFARARLVTEVHENAPTVPWESVIQTESETYLYATDGKTATKYPIRLGRIIQDRAEVLDSKLSIGQTVIVEGKYAVYDGSEIRVVSVNDAEAASSN